VTLFCAYFGVIGSVLTPTWYFQGVEKLTTLSAITLFCRCATVPATILLVRTPADTNLAVAITAGAQLIAGVLCQIVVLFVDKVPLVAIHIRQVVKTLQGGWHLFVATAAVSMYTNLTVILLAYFSGPVAVGQFSAAERLVRATMNILAPIGQAIFPRIGRLYSESRAQAVHLARRLLFLQAGVNVLVLLVLLIWSPIIVLTLYGSAYLASASALRWLAPLPLLVGISNVFGVQTMLPLGMTKLFSRLLLLAGVLNAVLIAALGPRFGADGGAMAVLLAEALVTALMGIALRAKGVDLLFRAERPALD
jgi:PST family polysaccharide transporter